MKTRSYFVNALAPAMLGLILGELLMTRQFMLLQPVLGSMTFGVVEILGAFLIDIPLACLSAFVFARKHAQIGPRGGMFAGAAFVTTFLLFIALVVLIRQFTSALDVFGLSDATATAVRTAREGLGGLFPVMLLMILVFDYVFCMLGGLAGFHLAAGERTQ